MVVPEVVSTDEVGNRAAGGAPRQRHALFVVFHFPPEASSSGVLRTLKYVKYLADFGWRVTVLTLRRDAYEITDETLEQQIPPSVRVVRTPYLNTKRHLSILRRYPAALAVPDSWVGWSFWAVKAGRRIFREDPYDLIYSTSPHATTHLIAQRLAEVSGRPWVMDFRDPWYEEPPEPGTPWVVHWAGRHLERRAVRRADLITTSTPQLRQDFADRYGAQMDGKVRCIFNGYDEADFAALPQARARRSEVMTILHAGNINAEFRDPIPLFRALRAAEDRGDVDLSKVRLRFIGPGEYAESAAVTREIEQLNLRECVVFEPRIPYDQALQQIVEADLLLLMQASDDTVGLVPAKLFEYLRARRPVLALVREGAAQTVLDETHGGWAVDPAYGEKLNQVVAEAYDLWRSDRLGERAAAPERLQRYSRRNLTKELSEAFDELAAPASVSSSSDR